MGEVARQKKPLGHRYKFRFTILLALIVTSASAFIFTWFHYQATRQTARSRQIEKFSRFESRVAVEKVRDQPWYQFACATDDEVVHSIQYLDARISNKDLQGLAVFGELEQLYIENSAVNDEGLAAITAFTQLQTLSLRRSKAIVGSELDCLSRLRLLDTIDLSETSTNDDGMKSIATLPHLQVLSLNHCPISDGSLQLLQCGQIAHLDLTGTPVSDRGVIALAQCKHLESLHLTNTAVTDDGIQHLSALPKLAALSLHGTQVTAAGVNALKEKLPNTTISSTDYLHDRRRFKKFLANQSQALHLGPWFGDDDLARFGHQIIQNSVLNLSQTNITDRGVGLILELPNVRIVDLSHTHITASGVGQLIENREIVELSLYGAPVDDRAIASLSKLPELRRLDLRETGVSGKSLSQLKSLRHLYLDGTQTDNDTLREIVNLPALETLWINHTFVTDDGIAILSQLKTLKEVEAVSPFVSTSSVENLQRQLPHAVINGGWQEFERDTD